MQVRRLWPLRRAVVTFSLIAFAWGTASTTVSLAQDTTSLPSGASSLTETFEDWTVSCRVVQEARRCVLSQQQTQKNGQRVWAIEARPGPDGSITGTLGLPFGLRLENGVSLSVDDKPVTETMQFSTCLPAGCMVPINVNAAVASALREGNILKVGAVVHDTGAPLSISVSLKGLAASLDRTVELLK